LKGFWPLAAAFENAAKSAENDKGKRALTGVEFSRQKIKRKGEKQITKRCWNHPTALSVGHLVPRCLLVLHLKNSVQQN
jgi:hypothetical protein